MIGLQYYPMGVREDIEALESKIARLKVEYEQYFMKLVKREPVRQRDEVEKIILFHSNKNISNTSLKFRFNSIVSKYNSYKQYWTRTLRAIEEGSYVRRAEGAENSELPSAPELKPKPGPSARAQGKDELLDIYDRYIESKKACKEPVEGITYESLVKTIEQARAKIEQMYKMKDVELKVYVKDGKTKLAITPKGRK